MCHFEVQIHLHCGHTTMIPRPCALQEAQAKKTNERGVVEPKDLRTCLHYMLPAAHSYLTCCEYCRGEMHDILLSPSGDQTLYAHLTLRACGDHMTPANYYKTCDRFEKRLSPDLQAIISGEGKETTKDGPAYLQPGVHYIDNYEEAYIRFACGHGHNFIMPKCTFRNTKAGTNMSEQMLFCGCFTGPVPKIPVSEMVLYEFPIASGSSSVKPVWEVTGPCWKYCQGQDLIHRGDDGYYRLWGRIVNEDRAYDKDNGTIANPQDPAHPGNCFQDEKEKVAHFLKNCEEWEAFDQWKTVAHSGDTETSGMRLKAASRYAGPIASRI